MPGTILRNTTGPFVSLPFLIPPGNSLALSLTGTGFSAALECTLDTDSIDWVQVGPTFSVSVLYNVPVGPLKFRLNLASGTLLSAQYSSSLVQVVQTTSGAVAGPDYSGAIAAVQGTASSAQGQATISTAALADLKRAPLSTPAGTRGVIFRGGIAYYPAPAGLIADGVNVIDEGATGLYYRSSGDVLPWEYGALPGGEFVGADSGVGLAAWAAGAPNHSRLYLPPGHWWTGQSLILQRTNLHLNFRGTLHASPGFAGYLVNADAGYTPAPAGQLPSYYDTTLGNALWYKRIQVEAMTLNGESHSKGVKFSRFDHYHISNVTVHKSYGHGIAMDRMREGNAYNFNILHSRAGPDNALFDLSEQGPADSTNVVNYFGIRIAVFTGRAMYYDSPFMTVQESANPVINASNLPGRFVNFYGLSVEDIIKGQGFKFDNVVTEYPDPTSDRIWIRRGRYINIRGGLINAGDITTGSVLRIGDSTLGQPVLSCLVDADVYAFAGTGYAVKAEAVINLNVSKEFWLSDAVKPILDPAGGRVPAENRQPVLTRMPGSQSVLRAVNEIAGAGDSPNLQLGDGWGNNLLLAQAGTNTGYSQFILKPAGASSTSFMGDTNGALWTSGTQIKLGSGTNKVAWASFAPQAAEPYDKSVGSIAIADVASWNPTGRGAGSKPYVALYNGVEWRDLPDVSAATRLIHARDFGFGVLGNTGAQNKTALQAALNACYAAGRHDLILPDALPTAAIPLASGTVVSSAMRISARGVCCITPSDSATYLLSIRRPSVAGDITAPGQVINGVFVSDEFAMGAGGMLKNVIFRNQLNTAAFTGFALSIGDAATTPAAAAEGVGFTLDGCAFAGFQTALGLYNNLWLFRADRCDFGANAKHLIDYGQSNKGENMTFTRCNFHDSPVAGSIEFQGDQSGGASNFKFSHCSVDYNVMPFLFSGKAYSVEMDSSWLEWGDASTAGTDATKNLPQVSAGAGASGNVLTFRGGAIVYIGATASRLAANGMVAGVGILLESPQFVRTRYVPIRNLGFQIVYVNSGSTTAYVSVPFAHADKGVPVVTPLNNTGAWWIDAPTTDDNDHFNIVVAVAPGVSGAKFLVRV